MIEEPLYNDDPIRAAGQFVSGKYSSWTEAMRPLRDRWSSLKKRYMNYRADNPSSHANKTRSNIGIPLPSQTVDTTMARIQADLFKASPYGKYKPTSPEDDVSAQQMQKVVDYQQRTSDFITQSMRAIKDALVFGVGHAKLVFDVQYQTLPEPRNISIPMPTFIAESGSIDVPVGTKKVRKKVMETPRLVADEPFNWFYAPDAPSVDEMEGIIHRTWQTARDLRMAVDGLGNRLYSDRLIEQVKNIKQDVDKDQQAQQADVTRGLGSAREGKHKVGRMEFLEYYGKLPDAISFKLVEQYYPDDDPDGDWIVCTVEGSGVTLRVEPSPHYTRKRPYFFAKISDEAGQVTGSGLLEKVEKLGLMVDGLYNNIIDNMNIINNRPVYINTSSGLKRQSVVFGPGKVWEGRMAPNDAIKVVDSPDISQSVWLLIRLLTGHYKEYTGTTDPTLGTSGAGDQTATEFAGLLASASTRNALHERTLEETFLKPLFRLWAVFNQQYLTDEFYIRVDSGSQYQFLRMKPENIQGLFDIEFEGSTKNQSAMVLASQIMQLIQINTAMPVPVNDIPKLITRLQKDAFEWNDSEDYLNPEYAELMNIMNQMMVMQKLGETAQAMTPQEAAQQKPNKAVNSKSNGGVASTPHNAPNPVTAGDVLKRVVETSQPDVVERQV